MQILTFHLGLLICLTASPNNGAALRTVGPRCFGGLGAVTASPRAASSPPFLKGKGRARRSQVWERWVFVGSSPSSKFQGFGAGRVQVFILLCHGKTSVWSKPGSDFHPHLTPQNLNDLERTRLEFSSSSSTPNSSNLEQNRFRFSSSSPIPKL